jgi:hypothetical protein
MFCLLHFNTISRLSYRKNHRACFTFILLFATTSYSPPLEGKKNILAVAVQLISNTFNPPPIIDVLVAALDP